MKITQSTAKKLLLTELNGLDPITVYLEDFELGQGKITITCFDDCWTNYWGAMSNRTISQFFIDVDVHYIAKKMSKIDSNIFDEDAMQDHLKKEIINLRRNYDIDADEARELWEDVKFNDWHKDNLHYNSDILVKLLGDDWYYGLPTKPNPDYLYLCKIINAVKDALKQQTTES